MITVITTVVILAALAYGILWTPQLLAAPSVAIHVLLLIIIIITWINGLRQKEIIKHLEYLKDNACPQLYFANTYAPTIIEKRIIQEKPSLSDALMNIGQPQLLPDGNYSFQGSVSAKKNVLKSSNLKFHAILSFDTNYAKPEGWCIVLFETHEA